VAGYGSEKFTVTPVTWLTSFENRFTLHQLRQLSMTLGLG
jgi:hypothetical protein